MKVTALDLRHNLKKVLESLDRNEPVAVFYRGKKRAVIFPVRDNKGPRLPVEEDPAVGMWEDRKDLKDVEKYVRKLRKARNHAV